MAGTWLCPKRRVPGLSGKAALFERVSERGCDQYQPEVQVRATFERMAAVVDRQNADDPQYQPMAGHFASSAAYQAACDLVFEGRQQPSGYTEPLLHAWRLRVKAASAK